MKSVAFIVASLVFIFAEDVENASKEKSLVNGNTKSDAEGSRTEESSDENIFFPLDILRPFDFQLAGHTQKLIVGNKIGLMVDTVGDILKPKPLDKEINFYNNLKTTEDRVLREMNQYVPLYFGVKYIDYGGEVVKFLHIENVLKDYRKVCSMDLKIGIQRGPPGTPIKPDGDRIFRYRKMMKEYGFAIPGFIYYDVKEKVTVRHGRELGHHMKPGQGIETLYNFVNKEVGIRCGVVRSILQQLRKIRDCFQQQRTYRFFDSSILLTYDAEHVKPCLENTELEGDVDHEGITVVVRVIDFGKATPVTDVNFNLTDGDSADKEDRNFMFGIRQMISVFENLSGLYITVPPSDSEERKV